MKTDLSLLLSVCIKKVESRLQTAFLRNLFMVKLFLVTSKTRKAAKYCTELRQQNTRNSKFAAKDTWTHTYLKQILNLTMYPTHEVRFHSLHHTIEQ